jgi:hypothetical protein
MDAATMVFPWEFAGDGLPRGSRSIRNASIASGIGYSESEVPERFGAGATCASSLSA